MTDPADTDLTARLAEALHRKNCQDDDPRDCSGRCIADADDLMLVVREYGDQRAAEELEAARQDLRQVPFSLALRDWLRDRAAALRGVAGR